MHPEISVVIPVYNEEVNIKHLIERLMTSLNALNRSFEIIFTNDGSKDQSLSLLCAAQEQYPDHISVINFKGNFGQHMAIIAGFEIARGDIIVTLDADLQNPPEEIYKLLEKVDEGYDYVSSYRDKRKDNFFRTYLSKMINWVREGITNVKMRDHGCMLRAYSRDIVKRIVQGNEHSAYIPILAYKFSNNPTEVEMRHASRAAGESKYNIVSLIRLTFDLITSFSIAPLQFFTMFGIGVSMASGLLVVYLLARRLIVGPEVGGVFTLFAVLFFLVSVLILGVGLIGEYIGRLSRNLSPLPRYEIKNLYLCHVKEAEKK